MYDINILLYLLKIILLESVSDLVTGDYMGEKTTLVYAVFTTPDNSVGGNAICAFKLEVIVI